jgi:drug/metabolite transporter (DMT)-like permease
MSGPQKNIYTGIGLAVLAALIWSGNFIIARGVNKQIPPVSLAFYRWLLATIIIFPFAIKRMKTEWSSIKSSGLYLSAVALTGISLFNTFVYIGAHYTSAINLALIGTTSSPVMAIILARIFLKEAIGWMKLLGLIVCIVGVLFLLSGGNFKNLAGHEYSKGDLWVLAAAFCFALYNTLVKKKPAGISPINFLSIAFALGTIMLLPFYIGELTSTDAVAWNTHLLLQVAYLGLGASVICFLIWNIAISRLGAGRTALFGNLIPIFSSIEAVFFLHEQFTWVHVVSMIIVFTGILLANVRLLR